MKHGNSRYRHLHENIYTLGIGFALVLIILMLHSFFNPPQKTSSLPLRGTIETFINDSTAIKSDLYLRFKD
jgi:hypothetical protein